MSNIISAYYHSGKLVTTNNMYFEPTHSFNKLGAYKHYKLNHFQFLIIKK